MATVPPHSVVHTPLYLLREVQAYIHCIYVKDHLKTAGPLQSRQGEKLWFQHHRAGRLRSCLLPAQRSDQSVDVLVCNDQEICRTPRADLQGWLVAEREQIFVELEVATKFAENV